MFGFIKHFFKDPKTLKEKRQGVKRSAQISTITYTYNLQPEYLQRIVWRRVRSSSEVAKRFVCNLRLPKFE